MAHIMACSRLLGQGHAMLGTPAVPRRPLFALEVPKAKDGPDLVGGNQPMAGGWNWMILEVPPNPTIPCFNDSFTTSAADVPSSR